ncbi:MAG: YkgJ family cysteine cluster protein [Chitinophagales bacterium]|nr:YkgJ family cysteine cluster protein [Chitinophagales bacterium]MDW8419810.1 YkgJ family cysteine cluster protein [Chitinophagales bacterium]
MRKLHIASFTRSVNKKKYKLRAFLRKLAQSKIRLNRYARQADKEIWKEVNCLACANCCKKMTPTYTKRDIHRIARHLGLTYQEYYDKYLRTDENNDIINRKTPCHFLGKDNKCIIYDIRPLDCRGFPHTNRKDIRYQVQEKTYTNNLTYCPATLLFVEKLQQMLADKL